MPKTVTLTDFCQAIYCARALWSALEPDASGTIRFSATVTDAGISRTHEVSFRGVTGLRRRSDRPGNPPAGGDLLELSVVELEGRPGDWHFWANPWYVHEIEFRCHEVWLDEQAVIGEGRCLQDELPSRSTDREHSG